MLSLSWALSALVLSDIYLFLLVGLLVVIAGAYGVLKAVLS